MSIAVVLIIPTVIAMVTATEVVSVHAALMFTTSHVSCMFIIVET